MILVIEDLLRSHNQLICVITDMTQVEEENYPTGSSVSSKELLDLAESVEIWQRLNTPEELMRRLIVLRYFYIRYEGEIIINTFVHEICFGFALICSEMGVEKRICDAILDKGRLYNSDFELFKMLRSGQQLYDLAVLKGANKWVYGVVLYFYKQWNLMKELQKKYDCPGYVTYDSNNGLIDDELWDLYFNHLDGWEHCSGDNYVKVSEFVAKELDPYLIPDLADIVRWYLRLF